MNLSEGTSVENLPFKPYCAIYFSRMQSTSNIWISFIAIPQNYYVGTMTSVTYGQTPYHALAYFTDTSVQFRSHSSGAGQFISNNPFILSFGY